MNAMRVIVMAGTLVVLAAIGWAQEPSPETTPPQSTATPGTKQKSAEPSRAPDAAATAEKERERDRKSWDELMEDWMTPKPYPKDAIVRIDEKYAYPHVAVGYKLEIVREDEDTVWMRGLPPEDPDSLYHNLWKYRQFLERERELRQKELSKPGAVYFVDFNAEPSSPRTVDRLQFQSVGSGLPKAGRWQMGFAVADLNGDGFVDLVFPPQRKAIPPRPTVFLGDGAGQFEVWREARWPQDVTFDYGDVAVADFDGDGHPDIAIACHFRPQFVLYGDGAGNFQRWETLPSPDPRLTSRALTAADFDGNGTTDLAFLAEIDYDRKFNAPIDEAATVWLVTRDAGTWTVHTENLPPNLIGDVISSADVDGNGRPDLVLSSNRVDWRFLVMFNHGLDEWVPSHYQGVLSAAYHFGVDSVEDQVFATFTQFRVVDGKNQARNGLIRYTMTQGDEPWQQGQPIFWDADRTNVYFRVAAGDLDGDGRTDLVAARKGGGLEIWLQENDGSFVRDTGPEFDAVGRIFDLHLVDLDGDGALDVIAAGTPQSGHPGGVFAWLTRNSDGEPAEN